MSEFHRTVFAFLLSLTVEDLFKFDISFEGDFEDIDEIDQSIVCFLKFKDQTSVVEKERIIFQARQFVSPAIVLDGGEYFSPLKKIVFFIQEDSIGFLNTVVMNMD